MLDPLLLKTFLVIAQGNSFSETSRKLSMRQSTVSDHVRRLELCLGRQLFVRDTHSVTLTPEGEALIPFATSIIETSERAERHFAGTKLRGRLRFGASEDVVVSWLSSILADFTRDHPELDLEFTIALSSTLTARFDAGELDVVLCKQWPGVERGDLVWRDQIVWVAATPDLLRMGNPLPLILYPPPSITRSVALAALGQAGMAWRIACTSDSLNGIATAARAGLGITVLARKMIPEGLIELPGAPRMAPFPGADLPTLGTLDFILLRKSRAASASAAELASAIAAKAALF